MTLRYLAASAAAIGLCALVACGSPSPAVAPRPSVAASTTPGTASITPSAASATPAAASATPGAPLPVLYNFGGGSGSDWNLAQREPVIFYLAADGSAALGDNAHHLKWTTWNNVSAAATGDYYYRTGPCCNYRSEAVTITASDVVRQSENKSWYDRMTIRFSTSKSLSIQFERIDGIGGWNTVAVPGPPTTPPPTTSAPSATASSGAPGYNNLSQLDQAITDWVVQTKGASLQSEAICAETSTYNYKCTVFYRPSGAQHVAIVSVTPNGSSFTVVSYN
jgi:hypothetical protein